MARAPLRDVVAKCSSWDAFCRALAKKSEKEKGDLFEHLVRAYLLLDPEYATKLRPQRSRGRSPWQLASKPR